MTPTQADHEAAARLMVEMGFRVVEVHQKLPAVDIPVCEHTRFQIESLIAAALSEAVRVAVDAALEGWRDQAFALCARRDWIMEPVFRLGIHVAEAAELTDAVRGKSGDPVEEAGDLIFSALAMIPKTISMAEVQRVNREKIERLWDAPVGFNREVRSDAQASTHNFHTPDGRCSGCGLPERKTHSLRCPADAQATPSPEATHRCKVCNASWRLNPPTKVQPEGSWSLMYPFHAGKCCDNAAMGDQIESLRGTPPETGEK